MPVLQGSLAGIPVEFWNSGDTILDYPAVELAPFFLFRRPVQRILNPVYKSLISKKTDPPVALRGRTNTIR